MAQFLLADQVWIDSNPIIELGKEIGHGTGGTVYTVKRNRNLIVKLPYCASYGRRGREHRCGRQIQPSKRLFNELQVYNDLKLYELPYIIPSKLIIVDDDIPAILKPRVTPLVDFYNIPNDVLNRRLLTDYNLQEIKKILYDMNQRGLAIQDGLQFGIDASGRLLYYDYERLKKTNPITAAGENNFYWLRLVKDLRN